MLSQPIDSDACYLALKSRDARFDGQFFTAVTSTGIYCRPVCRVKAPKRENCRFYVHAAQAESAGFRPCLRCRPELAPLSNEPVWSTLDASKMLASQAVKLLGDAALAGDDSSIAQIASQVGVSERHLRRIVEAHLGVSPLQYLQTRRLLSAKALLSDTKLPITDVALSSGFGSLRRFNAAFSEHYGMPPTRLRKQGAETSTPLQQEHGSIQIQLGFRPPYDAQALLAFWQERQLNTMEFIAPRAGSMQAKGHFSSENGLKSLIRSLGIEHQGQWLSGWLEATPDLEKNQLRVRMSEAFAPALPLITKRLRAAFDLDADPAAIDTALDSSFKAGVGMRVPGSLEGFEIAVRAILGQQVTVAAGRTFTQRVLQTFGEEIQTPWPQISRCFPKPQTLAQASPESLGALGIVKQRQAALIAVSRAVASGELNLNSPPQPLKVIEQLTELPGIGEWTANYIAMRALRWPDAFPAGDIALHNALGLRDEQSPGKRAKLAEVASQAWRPWRSYAVFRVWAGLHR
ncbi:DNA-3-methyladenine glycosylase 2 family protein [Variovorax sp. PCZ-1]|uniref:DNA-3-methyladenine glycosylase 2 family protein n=1 Tax=Variovorax sp. PCZ-1 TaxID=2835533 RepID=UPI001BCBD2FA|nr:DNA-3-methyladenine glycosylase 2 family protein [Variovorax sp. PCZ-1]MBS7806329.1 DNA-3-methyladenine glycosylase 2 family protein [Variovorax sp. PCZ-1]